MRLPGGSIAFWIGISQAGMMKMKAWSLRNRII
jgi:hypothetical protein